jgi:hypothetical protein
MNPPTTIDLLKIRRPSLYAFALAALGLVLYLAVLKDGFHPDFSAARAEKFLRRARGPRVFTGLAHDISPSCQNYYKSGRSVNRT